MGSTSTESTSMQYKLKEFYKRLTIPQAAWMKHSVESSIQDYYVDLHLLSDQVINGNQIFHDLKTKKILIESLPGYGKSTLVTKIAYDWSRNEQYTQIFDLVFLVPIRELQNRSVLEAIRDLVDIAGYEQPDEVREKIQKNEDKILLLLDGLDEVPPKVRYKIMSNFFTQMTVVITCRSGEFSLDSGDFRNWFRELPEKEFFGKHVTVLGIRKQQKTEFLKKYLHEIESFDNVIEHLKNMTQTAQKLFDSPLMLILLADMVVRGEQIGQVTSKTRFYNDFMIRRSEERRDLYLTLFTLFDAKNREKNLFIKLRQFGHLCFQRVWSGNQLEFDDNELTREIHKLGLLVNQKKISNTSCKNCYQIYHRTILEFMTAYYIFEDFQQNNLQFSKDIEQKLIEDVIDFGKSSMVTPFLIGLMRDKAYHYFNLMSAKYVNIFQYNQDAMWRMIIECECIDQVENSLIRNLPTDFHQVHSESLDIIQFYSSDLHKRLIKLGTEYGRIKQIMLDPSYKFNLPMDIELPNVTIYINNKPQDDDFLEILPHIACRRCNLVGYIGHRYIENVFIRSFKILMSIPSKLYTLESVNEDAINLMYVENELDKNILIDKLVYNYKELYSRKNQKSVFEATCNLLDRFHVTSFRLTTEDETDAVKFLSHCRKVDHLHLELNLNYEEKNSISMDALFLDKQWESIHLNMIKLTLPATKEIYVCKNVGFFGISENSVLSKISRVTHLNCGASSLHKLMQDPSWPNWQTLTEIKFIINFDLPSHEFWENFKLFPNLRLLQIEPTSIHFNSDILQNILQLPIHNLILVFRKSDSLFERPFSDELSFIQNLSTSLENLTITSLKILVIQIIDNKYPSKINNDFILKCADVLKFCSEKNMSLKTIELQLSKETLGVFDIERYCNLNVKFSFEKSDSIFVSMSNS